MLIRLILGNVMLVLCPRPSRPGSACADVREVLVVRPSGAPLFGFAIDGGAPSGAVVSFVEIPICRLIISDYAELRPFATSSAHYDEMRTFSQNAIQRIALADSDSWCAGRERSSAALPGSGCLSAVPACSAMLTDCYCLGESRSDGNCTPAPACNAGKRCTDTYGNNGPLGFCYSHSAMDVTIADLL